MDTTSLFLQYQNNGIQHKFFSVVCIIDRSKSICRRIFFYISAHVMVSLPDGYAFPVNTSASASPETFPSCPISRILFTSFTGFKCLLIPPIFNTKTKCLYFLFKASISLFSVSVTKDPFYLSI